jgi:glycosyltransferase involved in cell wall biosynthesis
LNNILIFPGWFPSVESPLNAIFTKKHIDVISKSNNVIVAYGISHIQKDKYIIIHDNTNGYPIITCSFRPNKFFIIKKFINFYLGLKAYYLAIKESRKYMNKVDFIHIHVITRQALIPFFYKIFKKIPYFISEHSTSYLRPNKNSHIDKILKILLTKKSNGISAVSESLKLAMMKEGLRNNNFMVIHNVVTSGFFRVKKEISQNSNFKFLHVSRLEEAAKNVIGILNSFEKLYAVKQNIELHIVGGNLNQVSDAEIYHHKLKSKSNIFFHGIKFGSEIIPYFQKSDCLIMFSNYETQAVVILESLFCGVPVIATNLPCLNEYLHNGNSIQVVPKDEKALFESMLVCTEDKYKFWSADKISSQIIKKFDQDEIGNAFDKFYQKGLKS